MQDTSNRDPSADPDRQRRLQRASMERCVDPRSYYARLRLAGPLDAEEGKLGQLQVLSRQDVLRVLRDTDVFSNAVPSHGSEETLIPLGVDPPMHTEYRRLLNPVFAPKGVAALQAAVEEGVKEMIGAVVDGGFCDFSSAVAVPLPCRVMLDLLGLPKSELGTLVEWTRALLRPDVETETVSEAQALQAATAKKVYARLSEEVKGRSADDGRDDLISHLLSARLEDGRLLNDDEILRTLFLMVAAGLDTVTCALECIFYFLATDADARQLATHRVGEIDLMIEELLRWESPVQTTVVRRALRDTELSGCPIPAGTLVLPSVAAANLDPEVEGNEQLDIRRRPKGHLAFGAGPHRCLGSHLARMEIEVAVREWHRAIPEYQIAAGEAIVWNGSSPRGLDYLPLSWVPTGGGQG